MTIINSNLLQVTFFQIGTEAFSASMQYCTASIAGLRCTDDIAMITLASATGTTLDSNIQ